MQHESSVNLIETTKKYAVIGAKVLGCSFGLISLISECLLLGPISFRLYETREKDLLKLQEAGVPLTEAELERIKGKEEDELPIRHLNFELDWDKNSLPPLTTIGFYCGALLGGIVGGGIGFLVSIFSSLAKAAINLLQYFSEKLNSTNNLSQQSFLRYNLFSKNKLKKLSSAQQDELLKKLEMDVKKSEGNLACLNNLSFA